MPYFSTIRNPGVVLRVPARMPLYPLLRTSCNIRRDLSLEFQDKPYLVAIPEHRANVFNATRSPRRSFRAGPATVATFTTGENSVPSFICHSTLPVRDRKSVV